MPLRWRKRQTLPPMPPSATGPRAASADTGNLSPFDDSDGLDDGGPIYGIDGAGYQHGDVFYNTECHR